MHREKVEEKKIIQYIDLNAANKEHSKYLKSCFYYNSRNYSSSINYLVENFEQSQILDTKLFCYILNGYLYDKNIDIYKLSKLLLIYSQSKNYFNKDNIDYLSRVINNYITKCIKKNQPILFNFICTFKDLITKNNRKLLTKNKIDNEHTCDYLEENINFEKIKNKTIIQSYYNDSCSGIGDFLRGCCFLFEFFKKKHGINLCIDFSNHDISQYIKSKTKRTVDLTSILDVEKINKENIPAIDYFENIKNNIVRAINSENKKIHICSNYSDIINYDPNKIYDYQISEECSAFMKSNLVFGKDIKDEYKKIISQHKIEKYEVIHFRCGDVELISGDINDESNVNTKKYNIFYDNLWKICLDVRNNIDKKLIIMSDSNKFKNYCKKQIQNNSIDYILVIHESSQHCSNQLGKITNISIDKKSKINSMFYVALDMFILSKASKIHSRSVYPWGSGFVFWIAKIFNIPISGRKIG